MDLGLSNRMARVLADLAPRVPTLPPLNSSNMSEVIHLETAQNEVPRYELLEFLKGTVDRLTERALELTDAYGGNIELREALAAFFNTYFKPIHPVKTDHIVVTAGASDAIESAIHAICDDGDSVIIPGPYWNGFNTLLKTRNNVNIISPRPPTYKNYDNYLLPSLQVAYDFAPAEVKPRIKAVVLTNPHNPLSRCYTKRGIVECMEFCQERGLHLISDEVYGGVRLDNRRRDDSEFVSALALTEPLVPEGAVKVDPSRVHVVWSASKLFGASGFRIGCLITQQNPTLHTALAHLTHHHAPNLSAHLLTSLLSWSQLPTLMVLNSQRLTLAYRMLASFLTEHDIDFIVPTDGIFLFAKIAPAARSQEEEVEALKRLERVSGVKVAPGHLFRGVEGDWGWARVRFAVREEVMRKVMEGLEKFFEGE